MFDSDDVISKYTRQQAIEDGVLVDVSSMASEAGFRFPVAVTHAVWEGYVAWTEEDSLQQVHQDESGRLWDVLWMASWAIRKASPGVSEVLFQFFCVPRNGKASKAKLTTLKAVCGPGDQGEPVITIMRLEED